MFKLYERTTQWNRKYEKVKHIEIDVKSKVIKSNKNIYSITRKQFKKRLMSNKKLGCKATVQKNIFDKLKSFLQIFSLFSHKIIGQKVKLISNKKIKKEPKICFCFILYNKSY